MPAESHMPPRPDVENISSGALRAEAKTEGAAPIVEDEKSVSYMGVRLEKSDVPSPYVPRRENYKDFINDQFALELQQKIAVGFRSGNPTLIEGGTSLGKTTTVQKMCSELGWEVHYVNLNGASDVEALMGRYIPNPHRVKPEDPEFIFADGKVTSGLRQEEGKTKVIILDEFNSAAPNIIIRLHEVLDGLERNSNVVLSEDASESIPVSKEQTKVIALTNPPGKGYFGREPLDPAQLRRWVYLKEKNTLPAETFTFSTRSLFGLEHESQGVAPEAFLTSREAALTPEQLVEIPGIAEIEPLYEEFHAGAKEMLAARNLAADQPQQFTFDDRMEPRRVRDFVLRFFNGDITDTFQQALRYYYVNKLESETDRQKLDELVSLVEYVPKTDSRRRGLGEHQDLTEASGKMAEARKILGKDYYGPEAVEAAFGFMPDIKSIPEIPFSEQELEAAKEFGQRLILRAGETDRGEPMTLAKMNQLLDGKLKDGRNLFYGVKAIKGTSLYTEPIPNRWVLTDAEEKQIGAMQIGKLQEHLDSLRLHAKNLAKVIDTNSYWRIQKAIDKYEYIRESTSTVLMEMEHDNLDLANMFLPSPAEIAYDLILRFQTTGERELSSNSVFSRTVLNGCPIIVGKFTNEGISVKTTEPEASHGRYFSQSFHE